MIGSSSAGSRRRPLSGTAGKLRHRTVLGCAAAGVILLGCGDPFGPGPPCQVISEFGTAGCAVVKVQIDRPEKLARRWLLQVTVRSVEGEFIAHAPEPVFGSFMLRLSLMPESRIAGGDTASVRFTALLVDVDASLDGTTEFIATDSVVRVIRFSPIGEVPQVDSVRLALR